MKPDINLQIEELVLSGLPPAQKSQIAAALQAELAHLLGEGSLPDGIRSGIYLPSLSLEHISPAGQKPAATGAAIARQIYQTLTTQAGSIPNGQPEGGLPHA